jgi:phthalate 4,5-dioxygenase reductase subunit
MSSSTFDRPFSTDLLPRFTIDLSMTQAIDPEFSSLRVQHKSQVARDVWHFKLVHPEGHALPAFKAGAHITVQTPAGQRRNYSLCNDPAESRYCEIAVKLERNGRGGSQSMVDQVQAGDLLSVSPPRNDFELIDNAADVIFIAGGIGVTPLLSMARQMARVHADSGQGRFRFYYCARDAEGAAFMPELQTLQSAGEVSFHFDGGNPDAGLDFWPLLEKPSQAHIYCCGPQGLMDAVKDMSGHWPQGRVHFESFGANALTHAANTPFSIKLSQSQTVLPVADNESILEALRKAGYRIPSSCESGTCGSCKTILVSGAVEHRDFVLNDSEKSTHIMVCVSRASVAKDLIEIDL